jgi:cytidyltransferase-like protein
VSSLRTAWSKPGDRVVDSETVPGSPTLPGSDPPTYPVVALGGTFDHLHAGHKILLSMAAWIADEKVIVGVTGMSLILYKDAAYKAIMQMMHSSQKKTTGRYWRVFPTESEVSASL